MRNGMHKGTWGEGGAAGICRRAAHGAAGAALAGLFLLLAVFFAVGMGMDVRLRAPEVVRYARGSPAGTLIGTVLMLAAVLALSAWMQRLRIRTMACVMALWTGLTILFLEAAGTRQMVDFAYVCDAASRFAQGDYQPLLGDYFHACSYQLGTCLLFEIVLRLLPGVDIGLFMQGANAVLSAASAGMLAAMCGVLTRDRRAGRSLLALVLLGLSIPLYCIHAYGTLPMIFLCSGAFLCVALYVSKGRLRFGVGCALLSAAAYMVKPNAAIVLLALLICAALHALLTKDCRLLLCAAGGILLAVMLANAAVWQYELRSGIRLREDVSMLARLTMGMQDGPRGAGWYNGYIEQFFPASVSAQQEHDIALADLTARLEQMGNNPVQTLKFFAQKALSQWIEPTYGTLLYGNACEQAGPFAQAAQAVFSEESALRMALEASMKAWQQALYLLSAVGVWRIWRDGRRSAASLILPVTVLGGFLYHMLFEAKSQYIYTYAVYLLPLAAQGLCTLKAEIFDFFKKRRRFARI